MAVAVAVAVAVVVAVVVVGVVVVVVDPRINEEMCHTPISTGLIGELKEFQHRGNLLL